MMGWVGSAGFGVAMAMCESNGCAGKVGKRRSKDRVKFVVVESLVGIAAIA
jgi:hypothetical protein